MIEEKEKLGKKINIESNTKVSAVFLLPGLAQKWKHTRIL